MSGVLTVSDGFPVFMVTAAGRCVFAWCVYVCMCGVCVYVYVCVCWNHNVRQYPPETIPLWTPPHPPPPRTDTHTHWFSSVCVGRKVPLPAHLHHELTSSHIHTFNRTNDEELYGGSTPLQELKHWVEPVHCHNCVCVTVWVCFDYGTLLSGGAETHTDKHTESRTLVRVVLLSILAVVVVPITLVHCWHFSVVLNRACLLMQRVEWGLLSVCVSVCVCVRERVCVWKCVFGWDALLSSLCVLMWFC